MSLLLWVFLGLVALISLLAYRNYFHPLAHIPGPPLAKVTYLYEWYYDLYRGGQFTFQLRALHDKYGIESTCPRSSGRTDVSFILSKAPSFALTLMKFISTTPISLTRSSTKPMAVQTSLCELQKLLGPILLYTLLLGPVYAILYEKESLIDLDSWYPIS